MRRRNFFFSFLLSLVLAWLSGCFQTDSGRDNSADIYDRYLGESLNDIPLADVDPTGRLHLLVAKDQIFAPSRPSAETEVYRIRNVTSTFYSYSNGNWDSTPLQSIWGSYSIASTFGPNSQWIYSMSKDPQGWPFLLVNSKLQYSLFSFSTQQWRNTFTVPNPYAWPFTCEKTLWSETDGFLGVCQSFSRSESQPGNLNATLSKQNLVLAQSSKTYRVLQSDTLYWRTLDHHLYRDTLDLILESSLIHPPYFTTSQNQWMRLIRKPGTSFLDSMTSVEQSLIQMNGIQFLPNDTLARLLIREEGERNGRLLGHALWHRDSISNFKPWAFSKLDSNTKILSGPGNCAVWFEPPISEAQADSHYSFSLNLGCSPHTDTLVLPSSTHIYDYPTVVASIGADVYVIAKGSPMDIQKTYPSPGWSDDSLMTYLRRQHQVEIHHWKNGKWEKIPIPF